MGLFGQKGHGARCSSSEAADHTLHFCLMRYRLTVQMRLKERLEVAFGGQTSISSQLAAADCQDQGD